MDILGTIGYRTEVDPSGISAGVKRAQAEVAAAMRRIDAMEATAKLQAEDTDLKRKIINAKRELLELDKAHSDPEVGLDDDEFQAKRKLIQAQIKQLSQEKIEVGYAFSEAQRTRREFEKAAATQTKMVGAQEKLLDAEKATTTETKKHNAELQKLRVHYVRLGDQMEALQRKVRKNPFRPDAADRLQFERLGSEIDLTGHKIRELGGDTNDLDIDLERQQGVLKRWGTSLANVRLHAGVMSLTIKQLGIVIGTLGPYIFAVMGAASTLIGVLGQGLAGAAGLAGAGLTGLALGAIGYVSAIKPALKSIGEARTEFEALHDAERRYGKGSDEAQAAQEKLNNTLKQMDPQAREATKSLTNITDQWAKLTEPTRAQFFDTMARGLGRAEALMPSFAAETNDFAKGLDLAAKNFLQAFNAGEMRAAMQGIMGPLSAALPTFGSALGNIAQGLGNIFSSFARHFQPVASGLENWSQGFLNMTENTGELNSKVDDLMASAESLVHFFAAAGRVISTFFQTGADEGRGWVDEMTGGLDRLNNWMSSVGGQSSLNSFFDDSITKTKILGDLLGGLGEGVFRMAELFSAPAAAVGDFLNVVVDLVTTLEKIPGLGAAIQVALGGALLSRLPLIGPMMTAGFARMGTTLSRSTVPALAAAGSGLSLLGSRAAPAAESTAKVGAAAGAATGFMRGFGGTILRSLPVVGTVATIGFLAADALGLFGDSSQEAQVAYGDWVSSLKQSGGDMRTVNGDILSMVTTAEQLGPALTKGGREGMMAMQQLRASLDPAQQRLNEIRQTNQDAWDSRGVMEFQHLVDGMTHDQLAQVSPFLDDIYKSVKANGEITDRWRQKLEGVGVSGDAINALNFALDPYQKGIEKAEKATAAFQLSLANIKRAGAGMDLLGPRAMRSMQPLIDMFSKKRVAKWAVEVEDSRAQRDLLELANRAGKLGGKKQVIDIMASDASAKQKIAALESLIDKLTDKKRSAKIDLETSGATRAAAALDSFVGKVVGKARIVQVGADVGTAVSGISKVIRMNIPDKSTTVRAVDAATGVINSVKSALASIPATVSSVVRTIYQTVGKPGNAEGGPAKLYNVPAFETGGLFGFPGAKNGDGRRGGRYARPTFLVGEEKRPEYVIATNPAYRRDNLRYLMQAAVALGVPAYARGKGGKGGKGGKRPDPGKKYTIGAIPESAGSSRYERAKAQYQSAKQKVNDLERAKKQADSGKQRRKVENRLDRARKRLKREKDQYQQAKVNWNALKKVNASINLAQAKIDKQQSLMDQYSIQGNVGGFDTSRQKRISTIDGLLKILKRAERKAGGQFKVELGDRIAQLMTERENTQRDTPGTEGVLTGAQTRDLERIQMEQALAQLSPAREDDVKAQQSLIGFWQRVLDDLKGRGAPPALITEAASNLIAAQESGGGGAGGGGVQSQGDIYSGARLDLYRTFGSNVSAFSAGSSPYSAGGAPGSGAGGGLSITNNFSAPPPDPHTWSQQQAYEVGTLGV